MEDKKIELKEQTRFSLINNIVASEVKIGKTLFQVSSGMANEEKSFKDAIRNLTEYQVSKISTTAG